MAAAVQVLQEGITMKTHKPRRKQEITDHVSYTGLAGKVVKCADSFVEDGEVHFAIRFADGTELVLVVAGQPKIVNAELLRWSMDGDSTVVRSYTKKK
jgi:hypothetical protein